jgi:hypothetical protein
VKTIYTDLILLYLLLFIIIIIIIIVSLYICHQSTIFVSGLTTKTHGLLLEIIHPQCLGLVSESLCGIAKKKYLADEIADAFSKTLQVKGWFEKG